MARVISLTLFLLSWLLLYSYAALGERIEETPSIECQVCSKVVDRIYQRVQNKDAQKCPKKETKILDYTDVADFLCKIRPVIDKLANHVCYELYPDACPLKTASTEDSKQKSKKNNKLTNRKESTKIKEKEGGLNFQKVAHKIAKTLGVRKN